MIFSKRFFLWPILACLLFLGVLAGAGQAQGYRPLPARYRTLKGLEAIQALGVQLPAAAARHHMSANALRALLLRDRDVSVDPSGQLVYSCAVFDPQHERPEENPSTRTAYFPLDDTFHLQSLPGAERTIYLDFTGHTTVGTQWNITYTGGAAIVSAPFDMDGNSASFSNAELEAIQEIWLRVAEDYAPFQINVTTEDLGTDALLRANLADTTYGTRVVFSASSSWFGTAGGVAYVGVFNLGSVLYQPAFVFTNFLGGSVKAFAEAASHEAGHTLGLNHDGITAGVEYFAGHGNWAPIMGNSYSRTVTQWSKGEYQNANNLQDDLAVMASFGAPPVVDDHGDTPAAATVLSGRMAGIIGTRGDVDCFQIVSGGGPLTVTTYNAVVGSNLDIRLDLYNSGGNLITSADPDGLSAVLSQNVAAGTYYVTVDGVGFGNPLNSGYSDYDSLGRYEIEATNDSPPVADAFEVDNTSGTARTITAGQAQTHSIHVVGDEDWAKFTLGAASSVDIQATGDTEMWLYGPNSAATQIQYDKGTGSLSRIQQGALPAGNYFIRVRQDQNVATISSYTLSLAVVPLPTFTVTAPNGGENWAADSVRTITWNSTGSAPSVKLEYSTNAGGSWTTIAASTANDGSESWTVPNTPTSQARVRVGLPDGSISDTSNANFTISPPTGDAFEPDNNASTAKAITIGQTQTRSIHVIGDEDWVSFVLDTTYSVDIQATGDTEMWLYGPNSAATQVQYDKGTGSLSRIQQTGLTAGVYYIRVRQDQNVATISSYTLSLAAQLFPTLTVTAPNGGENWTVGSSRNITWNAGGFSGSVKLEYSTDGGGSWNTIAASTANDGSEAWTVPNAVTTQARVRVSATNGAATDTSNANFTISIASSAATLTLGSGSARSGQNVTLNLAFAANGAQVGGGRLDLLFDPAKLTFVQAAKLALPAAATVTSQAVGSGRVRLQVAGAGNPLWSSGSILSVTFTLAAGVATGTTSPVQVALPDTTTPGVELSDGSGVPSLAGAQGGTVTFTNRPRGDINNDDQVNQADLDALAAVLLGQAAVDLPVQDLNADGGVDVADYVTLANLLLGVGTAPGNGTGATAAAFALQSAAAAPGATVTLPLAFAANGTQVAAGRVDLLFDPAKLTFVDAARLTLPGAVNIAGAVVSPGRVRLLVAGLSNTAWSTGNVLNVRFTLAAGLNPGSTASVQLALPGSSAAGVEVSSPAGVSGTAAGQASTLTVQAIGSLTLTAPNGGENWNEGSTQTITWTSASVSGSVKLEYSTNSGTTWTPITASTANDGSEPWVVPGTAASQVRVRISSVDNPAVSDTSDADFSIRYVGGVLKLPAKVNFGAVKVIKPKLKSITLQNTSKTAALIVTVSSSDTRFRITTGGGTTTIPPRGKLVVKVSCEPTAAGALTGALQVASSDPAKPSAATQLKAVGK